MSGEAFFYLLVAYLLYLATRRFVVKSTPSHIVLFGIMLALTCVALPLADALMSSAQFRHEREVQRARVNSRIAQAGGWEALRRDCVSLMEQFGDSYHVWNGRDTNGLPATVAALKPMSVQYYPTKFLRELKEGRFTDPPNVQLVRIRLFGMHSTGVHSTPYFGLEIVGGPGSKDYAPSPHDAVSGNRHMSFSKVAEGIYEIY